MFFFGPVCQLKCEIHFTVPEFRLGLSDNLFHYPTGTLNLQALKDIDLAYYLWLSD